MWLFSSIFSKKNEPLGSLCRWNFNYFFFGKSAISLIISVCHILYIFQLAPIIRKQKWIYQADASHFPQFHFWLYRNKSVYNDDDDVRLHTTRLFHTLTHMNIWLEGATWPHRLTLLFDWFFIFHWTAAVGGAATNTRLILIHRASMRCQQFDYLTGGSRRNAWGGWSE